MTTNWSTSPAIGATSLRAVVLVSLDLVIAVDTSIPQLVDAGGAGAAGELAAP